MAKQVRSTAYVQGLLAAGVLAMMGTGCSSNPLDGTWITAGTLAGVTVTDNVIVDGDGTLSVKSTASGSCTGTEEWTGYSWAATSTSVTFSGTATCSGAFTCGAVSVNCSGSTDPPLKTGSCTYAISDDNDTLALTACSGTADATLTRQ